MQPLPSNALKVLVVDDSWTDLTMMANPLHEYGYNVVTAMDGEEAIEKAVFEQPNCIVLDVILPKQNGFAVCRRLKQLEACRQIPIILISSKNTPQDRHWGMQQGADIYLTKPFRETELLASVRSLL
ncbi:MAG: response regulator [Ktedonobacterales bacterium]|nr:response regulator [Ktedonobacterales bacterium]